MAHKYADRFHTFQGSEIQSDGNGGFNIDENTDGKADYNVGNNNFNYQAFLSNLVLRWEYSPGSSVYLVWSQTRQNQIGTGTMDYFSNVKDLFEITPKNVFLVKFSYRFGLK